MIPFEKQEEIARKEVELDIKMFDRKFKWHATWVVLCFAFCFVWLLVLGENTVLKSIIFFAYAVALAIHGTEAITYYQLATKLKANIEHHILNHLGDYPSRDDQ